MKNTEKTRVDVTPEQLQILVVQKLIESNPDLYKCDESGNVYHIILEEDGSKNMTFESINRSWGKDQKYDAEIDYQRLKDRHKKTAQRKILHDILIGEKVGRFVFYQKPQTIERFEVVDGKQRMEIMRSFIKGTLTLQGKLAASFWAKYLPYLNQYGVESVSVNQIKHQIAFGKQIKDVVFKELPSNLRDDILQIGFDVSIIKKVLFQNIFTTTPIGFGHPDYDEDIARKAIIKKFSKLNTQVKQADTIDTIYGQTSDFVVESRDFVRILHPYLNEIGVTLDTECETDSQRQFAMVLVKTLMIFEKNKTGKYLVDWAASPKTLETLICDGVADNLSEQSQKFIKVFLKKTLRKIFSETYLKTDKEGYVVVPDEFKGVKKTTINLILFISLYTFYKKMVESYDFRKKYMNDGEPTNRMFRFIQELLNYVSIASLASKNENEKEAVKEASPIIRYGLIDDWVDINKGDLLRKMMNLNLHNAGKGKDFRNTISLVIDMIDNKIS